MEIYGNLGAVLALYGQFRPITMLFVASAAGLVFCLLTTGRSPPHR
jgi:hypothetical protein